MKTKKQWWEKEWDFLFKRLLKETAVVIDPKHPFTFNELAKQKIDYIVQQEIRAMCKRHNMIAIGIERSQQKNRDNIRMVRRLINAFETTRDSANKYAKELKQILK